MSRIPLTLALGILCVPSQPSVAGQLDPPGAPAPTEIGIDAAEARTPVNSLPGSITSLHVISEQGSYYLTENISGESGRNGIEVTSTQVYLDLNGFSLVGVAGSLDGINATGQNLTVTGGIIVGWGEDGLDSSDSPETVVNDVQAASCGAEGIWVGINGYVENCVARDNGQSGIRGGLLGIVRDSLSSGNEGPGFRINEGYLVENCVSNNNSDDGFLLANANEIRGCYSNANFFGDGMGVGIRVTGFDNTVDNNYVRSNADGIVVEAAGNLVIRNRASGNGAGPDDYTVAAGNTVGPIVTVSDPIVSTNPWANIQF
jgi:parallel beta-helix repeat protein